MKIGIFVSFLFLIGCSNTYKGYKLSQFYYNGKRSNAKILNRIPDYGISNTDGCIRMQEMKLDLVKTQGEVFKGVVRDVRNKETVNYPKITVAYHSQTPFEIIGDSIGRFEFKNFGKDVYISVNTLGYRALCVKLLK